MPDGDEVSMERTLNELRRDKRRKAEQGRKPFLSRLGAGKVGKFGKAALMAGMLGSPAAGQARDGQSQAGLRAPEPVVQTLSPEAQQETLSPDQEAVKGREMSRQRQQASRLSEAPQSQQNSGSRQVQEEQEVNQQAETEEENPAAELRELQQNQRLQQQKEEEGGEDAVKIAATKAALEVSRKGWGMVHESLEDTALSFVDFDIISGPATIIVYLVRLGAYLYGRIVTVNVQGVKVPFIPTFTMPELVVRSSKTLIIAIMTIAVWGIIYLTIWILTSPVDAAIKIFGQTLVDAITGK